MGVNLKFSEFEKSEKGEVTRAPQIIVSLCTVLRGAPALAEEKRVVCLIQSHVSSGGNSYWSRPVPVVQQRDVVHLLGQTASVTAVEGCAEPFGEVRVGSYAAPSMVPESPFSEYQLCLQAVSEAIQKWAVVYTSSSCLLLLNAVRGKGRASENR